MMTGSSPATTKAAAVEGRWWWVLTPIMLATTMNVRDVACMKAPARTCARELGNSASMLRLAPVVKKNHSDQEADADRFEFAFEHLVKAGDSPARRTLIPVRNAPRMVANPKCLATTTKASEQGQRHQDANAWPAGLSTRRLNYRKSIS